MMTDDDKEEYSKEGRGQTTYNAKENERMLRLQLRRAVVYVK